MDISKLLDLGSVNQFLSGLDRESFPVFTSVDIRNAGFKIAPVDTNLFPAGFNNITEKGLKALTEALLAFLGQKYPGARSIIIFPENFTRNTKYLESLSMLKKAVEGAGISAIVGSTLLEEDFHSEFLEIKKLDSLEDADLLLLNNDLTDGIPEALKECSIPIEPSTSFGWHTRRKSRHFECYSNVVEKFSDASGIDPWLLKAEFEVCKDIDFRNKVGLECVAHYTEEVLKKIRIHYARYGIKQEPFVFIKPNQGTYGMGVMVARDPEDVMQINKRKRHSMSALKHGISNTEVLIQEGVPTISTFSGAPSENLEYMCYGEVIESLIRFNSEKDATSSLNTRGMQFEAAETNPIVEAVAILASYATSME